MFTGSVSRSELTPRTLWLAVTVTALFLGALYGFSQGARQIRVSSAPLASGQAISGHPTSTGGSNKTISYRGVSFSYSRSLASDIKTETKPAYFLELSTDTGQGVVPEHIVFQLVGPYASLHESSFFSPEILIFPIKTYRQVLSKSRSYVNQFDHELGVFKYMISRRPESWNREVPVLPFAYRRFAGLSCPPRIREIPKWRGRHVSNPIQYREGSHQQCRLGLHISGSD
jgi:hypothetical protein